MQQSIAQVVIWSTCTAAVASWKLYGIHSLDAVDGASDTSLLLSSPRDTKGLSAAAIWRVEALSLRN